MLKDVWNFFQDEVLGMKWLNRLIGSGLEAVGLDTSGKVGGSVQFFIYDVVKIMVLLGFLILMISYIQSYFPPERTKRILNCCFTGDSYTVLLLFIYPFVYWLYQCRTSVRGYLLVSYIFSNG